MATNVFGSRIGGISHGVGTDAWTFAVPLGRLLFVAIFLLSVPMHFTSQGIAHAASQGVPMANLLVPLSGVLALVGGLSVLLGFHARIGALLLIAFLLPVTFMMHDFWNVTEPGARMLHRISFLKNLAMMGGALFIAYFGSGPFSLDARMPRRLRA